MHDKNLPVSRDAGTQACDCKRDRLWVRFPLDKMKYLIFLYGCSAENGEWNALTLGFSLPAVYEIQREDKKVFFFFIFLRMLFY